MNVPRFWKLINMISKKVFNLHELISENGKWILASHWLNQQVMRMQHPYSPDLYASRERLWIHVLFTQSNEKMCSSDTEKHKFSHSHFRTKPDPEAIRQSNYGQFAWKKKTTTVLQHFNFQHPYSFILKKYSCKTALISIFSLVYICEYWWEPKNHLFPELYSLFFLYPSQSIPKRDFVLQDQNRDWLVWPIIMKWTNKRI